MGITEKKFPSSQSAKSDTFFVPWSRLNFIGKKVKQMSRSKTPLPVTGQHPESLPFSVSYSLFGDFSKCLHSLKTKLALLNPHHSFLPPSPNSSHAALSFPPFYHRQRQKWSFALAQLPWDAATSFSSLQPPRTCACQWGLGRLPPCRIP